MANRKMTFSFPEDIALRFVRTVPSSRRSRYVAELIEAKMRERERRMIAACEAANADPDVAAIEREMDVLSGDGLEGLVWHDPKKR